MARIRLRNTVIVSVAGLLHGAVLGALAEFWAYSHNILQNIQGSMLGDFSKISQGSYEVIWLILPVVLVTFAFARRFTILGMGEEAATSLVLSYRSMVILRLVPVSATVAVTVIAAGAIPFIGLVVPNSVWLYHGDNLSRTLPSVAPGGASLLSACAILGRRLIWPYEVPIGLTVGGIGGLMFLLLILRRKR